MAAITSIVIANEDKIVPYFDSILPLLDMCFGLKDGEHFMRLREALAAWVISRNTVGARSFILYLTNL